MVVDDELLALVAAQDVREQTILGDDWDLLSVRLRIEFVPGFGQSMSSESIDGRETGDVQFGQFILRKVSVKLVLVHDSS